MASRSCIATIVWTCAWCCFFPTAFGFRRQFQGARERVRPHRDLHAELRALVHRDLNASDDIPLGANWTPSVFQEEFNRSRLLGRHSHHVRLIPEKPGHHTNSTFHVLMALGGGTGASIGRPGNWEADRDLLRRMRCQDKAVMCLVLGIYFVALIFSATLTYRQASNNSRVTFYADPRYHSLGIEGNDLDEFLDTFNQAPKDVALQVTGFYPLGEGQDEERHGNVHWQGQNFQVAFTFSLDLSPWVQRAAQTHPTTSQEQVRSLQDGMLPEDRSLVHNALMLNTNDLAYMEIKKEVAWADWEELATNIKHQIRQRGFNGVITVNRIDAQPLQVFKNKAWANFMHARATRVLCALSFVGWVLYVPYMWLRCRKLSLRSYHCVDIRISEYWHLIEDKLTADGFVDSNAAQVLPRPQS